MESLKIEYLTEDKLIVKSKYWEVVHEANKGGCISSIRFYNGTNQNILLKPVTSYMGPFQDVLNRDAKIEVTNEGRRIIVNVAGELKTLNNSIKSGIAYNYSYKYHEGYVKVTESFHLEKGLGGIRGIGIGCMEITPEMTYFAARESPISAQDRIPRGERLCRCPADWGKINFDGKPSFTETNVPMYLGVYNIGVEGVEFIPGSNLEEWTTQVVKKRDVGRYQIIGDANPERVKIIIEPASPRIGLTLSGTYTFTYYIGLPKIPEKIPRKYMHMVFDPYPWPTDEEIRRWAYAGVNVVRIHNDYHPSGYYWHDGVWPPYDEKGMAELKRVINTCHRYGIKVVPYFSLFELNAKSEAFADNHIYWRRTVDEKGLWILETYPPFYYGFVMCLSSSFKDFLKNYVKKVVKTLGFDGVYYDHADFWFCTNKIHKRGIHSTIDDLIDFLEYTRELVGENGIILLHQSGWFPCMLTENYADGHIMFEDNARWMEIPPLEEWPPNAMHIRFNIAPKLPVPVKGVDRAEGLWNLCSKCLVLGAFPYSRLGPGSEAVLALFETFRAFDLSQFKFRDYTFGLVETSNESIRGAVYFDEDRAIVVLANVTGNRGEKFRWKIKLERIGLKSSWKYHVTDSLGKHSCILEGRVISKNGVEDSLDGYRFKAYYIVKHVKERKRVLYNTRAWIEKHVDGKLIVETSGPEGQEAVLKIYAPEKPQKIKLNSKILEENEDWAWDEETKTATIMYRYCDTKAKVIIQII
ncbi:hypothetical protein J7L29_03125 [Candidatus Bathyarchaeota archaeon]|nr:hypothetical protein [Candidatus Bathyarchaeota archaeon]